MYFQIDLSVNREQPQNKFNCREYMSSLQTIQKNYPIHSVKLRNNKYMCKNKSTFQRRPIEVFMFNIGGFSGLFWFFKMSN